MELGYLNIPEGILINIDSVSRYPHDKLVIITTGSQGEPMAALSRIATLDHKKIEIKKGDTMNDFIKDNLLIICPNEQKIKILEELSKEDKLYDIKFLKTGVLKCLK